ncbi:MAG: penicillin-binding protein 2 [Capsulimonadaceae bacterium]|nr:penicillin-binding protein 2 [Capsulimonadaceae bacterium]
MRKSSTTAASGLDPFYAPRTDQISRARARILGIILLAPFAVLAARLWYLQIAHGEDYFRAAESNRTRILRVGAPRGLILDNTGAILASTRPEYAVYAVPAVAHRKDILRRLSAILNMSPDEIQGVLTAERRNNYSPVRLALNVSLATITRVEEDRPYLPGVSTAPEPVRWYPRDSLLANTLGSLGRIDSTMYRAKRGSGYFSDDFVGKGGIEAQYESLLHGTPGGTLVEVQARGGAPVNLGQIEPIPGRTLRLTVDQGVQRAAEDTYREHGWTGGAVALDINTGAVLAMASAPTYNPNAFAKGINGREWATLRLNPGKPLLNRPVDSLYPPGSTFKQVVGLVGLASHVVTSGTTYICNGSLMIEKQRFGCWAVHGPVDFRKAIADSCDVYFYKTGMLAGPTRISRFAKEYGLARLSGIDLPHEMIGSVPSPEWKERRFRKLGPIWAEWYTGDTLNMSIGQGFVLTTPLQMAMVTAATANGGTVFKPYLLNSVLDPLTGEVSQKTVPSVLSRVYAPEECFQVVREGMRDCVTDGTGQIVNFKSMAVAAKTGSSQVTGSNRTHGWFVAFAPYHNPKIAIAAIVEHGGHGGDTAGKVAYAMLKAYFHLNNEQTAKPARTD